MPLRSEAHRVTGSSLVGWLGQVLARGLSPSPSFEIHLKLAAALPPDMRGLVCSAGESPGDKSCPKWGQHYEDSTGPSFQGKRGNRYTRDPNATDQVLSGQRDYQRLSVFFIIFIPREPFWEERVTTVAEHTF